MKRDFLILWSLLFVASVLYGSFSEAETRKEFEGRYLKWCEKLKQIGTFLSDEGESLKEFTDILELGVKALPILVERMRQDCRLSHAITMISGWRLIPGEMEQKRIYGGIAASNYYSEWWQNGQAGIKKLFDERYVAWKSAKTKAMKKDADQLLKTLDSLGVAAFPYFFEKIGNNDLEFIPVVSRLSKHAIKPDATIQECLAWWKKNKEEWMIPFPDNRVPGR